VRVQIKKTEVFAFMMEMSDDLFDGENGRVTFGCGVDITAVEIDAIGVDSVVPPGHSVRVDDGKQVEDKFISE
jgi:hypothetical protein